MVTGEVFTIGDPATSRSPTLLRSALAPGRRVSKLTVSVEVLLFGVLSPGGAVTAAVFTRVPEAEGLTPAVTTKVTEPPDRIVTVSFMSPVPLLVVTLEPTEAVAIQVSLEKPATAVSASVTVWFAAVSGPLLLTTIV